MFNNLKRKSSIPPCSKEPSVQGILEQKHYEKVHGFGNNTGIFCTKCNKAVSSTTNRISAKKNRIDENK